MELIKQDLNNFIDQYLSDKGGDISPLLSLRLDETVTELAIYLQKIIDANKNIF
jgi:hypothetical protein